MDSIKFNGHLNQQLFITNCDNSQKDDLDKFLFIFLMSILLDSIIGDSEIWFISNRLDYLRIVGAISVRALTKEDCEVFNKTNDKAKLHAQAIAKGILIDPVEGMLLSVILEMRGASKA